jgi:hypothetical protein
MWHHAEKIEKGAAKAPFSYPGPERLGPRFLALELFLCL